MRWSSRWWWWVGWYLQTAQWKMGAQRSQPQRHSRPDEVQTVVKKWEATSEGINFKKWEASFAGQKVLASAAKIIGLLKDSSDVAAFVTSLSLPSGSRLGFAVMVRMKGDDYILSFGPLQSNKFQQLRTLKVNDEIIVRSHFVSYAPRYSYPIVTGNYVARGNEIIYKAPPRKGGCWVELLM